MFSFIGLDLDQARDELFPNWVWKRSQKQWAFLTDDKTRKLRKERKLQRRKTWLKMKLNLIIGIRMKLQKQKKAHETFCHPCFLWKEIWEVENFLRGMMKKKLWQRNTIAIILLLIIHLDIRNRTQNNQNFQLIHETKRLMRTFHRITFVTS